MYLYITTRLNQGYKVGIAEDIEQRQQQYTTLIPNIGFSLFVQTGAAEEIEKSFKHKFNDFRIINRTSSKEMKSEVYQIKLKYLKMHFINCMHLRGSSVILTDNHKCFSKNCFLQNKMSFYLSNYYLPYKNYDTKFSHFNIISNHSIWKKIKIAEIDVKNAEFNKKNELINHPSEFEYYDLDTENWRNIIKLYFENTNISQLEFDKQIEKLNIKKKEKKFNGYFIGKNYLSPFDEALGFLKAIYFKKMISFNCIREFSQNKNKLSSGWTSERLRMFGMPYPLLEKFNFNEK